MGFQTLALCIGLALAISLDYPALRPEVIQIALEDGVLTEFAIELTIVQGYFQAGLQS